MRSFDRLTGADSVGDSSEKLQLSPSKRQARRRRITLEGLPGGADPSIAAAMADRQRVRIQGKDSHTSEKAITGSERLKEQVVRAHERKLDKLGREVLEVLIGVCKEREIPLITLLTVHLHDLSTVFTEEQYAFFCEKVDHLPNWLAHTAAYSRTCLELFSLFNKTVQGWSEQQLAAEMQKDGLTVFREQLLNDAQTGEHIVAEYPYVDSKGNAQGLLDYFYKEMLTRAKDYYNAMGMPLPKGVFDRPEFIIVLEPATTEKIKRVAELLQQTKMEEVQAPVKKVVKQIIGVDVTQWSSEEVHVWKERVDMLMISLQQGEDLEEALSALAELEGVERNMLIQGVYGATSLVARDGIAAGWMKIDLVRLRSALGRMN